MSNRKHQSARPGSEVWLTDPLLLDALGGWRSFDLDPCAAPAPQPWPTARRMNTRLDDNGLLIRWQGRVWLNPPYTRGELVRWLARMADHDHGTALIPVASGTKQWRDFVWPRAAGVLFLYGRLCFYEPDGTRKRGRQNNAGGDSVLVAYGQDDLDRLEASGLNGRLVPLRFARYVFVEAIASETWSTLVLDYLARHRGPVSIEEVYRHFQRHPKARRNRNVDAKVRQKLREHARRVGPGLYEAAA